MEDRGGISQTGGSQGMKESLRRELERLAGGNVRYDEPLADHTSMGVGGAALAVVYPDTRERLGATLTFLKSEGMACLPVGNGTNLIVRDGGYRGVIVCLKRLADIRIVAAAGEAALLQAEAGASLAELVSRSAAAGLAGLEFCAGIPGSVGGAVTMNAGAYGREIKDVLAELIMMDRTGETGVWRRDRLEFFYRRFVSPVAGGVIVAAAFRLVPGNREEIQERIREIRQLRKQKHPLEYRNAGSIFKNPPGRPAGRLIEEAGLKGLRIGDAEVSEKHGNFIVNRGGATARDVLDLIAVIQEKVFREKGVRLETEVIVIGEEA